MHPAACALFASTVGGRSAGVRGRSCHPSHSGTHASSRVCSVRICCWRPKRRGARGTLPPKPCRHRASALTPAGPRASGHVRFCSDLMLAAESAPYTASHPLGSVYLYCGYPAGRHGNAGYPGHHQQWMRTERNGRGTGSPGPPISVDISARGQPRPMPTRCGRSQRRAPAPSPAPPPPTLNANRTQCPAHSMPGLPASTGHDLAE